MRTLKVWEYKLRLKMVAYLNWRAGYALSPVKRCRLCQHTAPHHMALCPNWKSTRNSWR